MFMSRPQLDLSVPTTSSPTLPSHATSRIIQYTQHAGRPHTPHQSTPFRPPHTGHPNTSSTSRLPANSNPLRTRHHARPRENHLVVHTAHTQTQTQTRTRAPAPAPALPRRDGPRLRVAHAGSRIHVAGTVAGTLGIAIVVLVGRGEARVQH